MWYFKRKNSRYIVQAKRKKKNEAWTDWTTVDDYDEAVKHTKYAAKVGYESRIVDREEKK